MCENEMILGLDAEALSRMKTDFNELLGRTIGSMEMKHADEATITLKLSIGLTRTRVPNGPTVDDVTMPTFKHDISSMIQVKDKVSGNYKGRTKLVYDEEEGKWILVDLEDDQTSLFDKDGVINGHYEVVDEEEVEDSFITKAKKALPEGGKYLEESAPEEEDYHSDSDEDEPEDLPYDEPEE